MEEDPADENHARSIDNLRRLESRGAIATLRSASSRCRFPRPVIMNGERLPASYANFYIGNGVVAGADVQRPNDRVRARHASPS